MIKRADGRWQEAITINGKRKYFYGTTKAEVLRKLRDFSEGREHGEKFAVVADQWDRWHEGEVTYKGHIAYRSAYKAAVARFGSQRVDDITSQEIAAYINELAKKRYAKRTVQLHLSFLNMVFDYAALNGYGTNNPARIVRLPKNLKTTKRELPDDADIQRVKDNISAPFGLFAFFIMCTGLRRGEALALTYNDIDFDRKTISVTKSVYYESNQPLVKEPKTEAGKRTVVLLDILAKELPKGKGYVFGGEKPMSQIMFRHAWERYKKATGITFTPHQLRHLYATLLYEAGIDEKLAQELMGHSSITTTHNIYTHIRQKRLESAAAQLNERIRI